MYQCDQLPSLSRCRVGLNKKKEAKNSNVKPYWPRFIRLIYRIISVVRFYRRLSGVRLKCQNPIPGFQLFLRPSTRVIQTAVGSAEGSDQSINKSSSGKLVPLQTGIRNRSFIFESWHPQADGRLPQPQGTFWFLAAFVFTLLLHDPGQSTLEPHSRTLHPDFVCVELPACLLSVPSSRGMCFYYYSNEHLNGKEKERRAPPPDAQRRFDLMYKKAEK